MKWIFQLSAVILLFNGCWNSKNENLNLSTQVTFKANRNIEIIDSNLSFIGRQSTLIDSLKWFHCWGSLLLSTNGETTNLGIEQVSSSKSECNTGNSKILLVKLLYRTANGKPVNLILDELNVRSDEDKNYYLFATCKLKGTDQNETVLAHYKIVKETWRSEIMEMWRIDSPKSTFVKVTSPGMFECIEEEGCIDEDDI
ncbi:MAG: hypothetical protein K9G42_02550 [Pedobacter sp.]|nr:hypothetical protein [Pedobacter sp.]